MGEKKVFVGNVNFNASKDELWDFFRDCRGILEVAIIIDRDNRRSKGYAFIIFDSEEAAREAVNRMDGQEFQGRPLKVKLADNQDNNRSFKDFDSGRDKYDGYNRGGRGAYGDAWRAYAANQGYRLNDDYSGSNYGHDRSGYDYRYQQYRYGSGDHHGSNAYYGRDDQHTGYNYY